MLNFLSLDANAKTSENAVSFGTQSSKSFISVPKPFLLPTESVSMRKIGKHLKHSKPKTFAFSSNSFSFRAPVFSQTNLQRGTKDIQTIPRTKVFVKQNINRHKPVVTKTIHQSNVVQTKTLKGNDIASKNKNSLKPDMLSKIVKANRSAGNENLHKLGSVNKVTKSADENPGLRSDMHFSLQNTQRNTNNDEKVKSSLGSYKENDARPVMRRKIIKTIKRTIKIIRPKRVNEITKTPTLNAKVNVKKSDNAMEKRWMNNITRSDAMQTPVVKELAPKKPPISKMTHGKSTSHTMQSDKVPVSAKLPYKEQNLTKQRKVTKNLVMKKINDVGVSRNKMDKEKNIEAKKTFSVTKKAESIPAEIAKPSTLAEKISNNLFIPLPPGEILDAGQFMNLRSKQLQRPTVVNSESKRNRDVLLRTPPQIQKTIMNNFQTVHRNKEMAGNRIPQVLQKFNTDQRSLSPLMVKRPLQAVSMPIKNGLSSGSIQVMREPVQATGLSGSATLPETFNPLPSSLGQLGFIPPPPPDGFRRQPIQNPPGPWNRVLQPPPLPPTSGNRLNYQNGIFPKRKYIQPKVPISEVIPQPPSVILRESNRFSRHQNIGPNPQLADANSAYLTKAPNKQNQVPLNIQGQRNIISRRLNQPRNFHHGGHDLNTNLNQKLQKPPSQKFVDVTGVFDITPSPPPPPPTRQPTAAPQRRDPPKPAKFDPLKHLTKGKKGPSKQAKRPTNSRKPPEPPEGTTIPDPDRKIFNQKIFKNSFQKEYVNERRGRHPMKKFMTDFERFMKNMDSFFDLSGMLEF